MEKKKIVAWCNECKSAKDSGEFYTRLVDLSYEKLTKYDTDATTIVSSAIDSKNNGICKKCLTDKYFNYLNENKGNIGRSIYFLCKEYNLPFDGKIIKDGVSCSQSLRDYIRQISSLPQYKNVGFEDKIIETGLDLASKNIELSDIDFINEDIKRIKENIVSALDKNDINSHGKWLNSLRDALELRDRLQGVQDHQHQLFVNGQTYTTGGSTII